MWPVVILLATVSWSEAGRITVSKSQNVTKIDELCARMHNNTALEGVDPIEMMQVNAAECQKKCVDAYPVCSAVVYYYLEGEKKHHQCYLFEFNSLKDEANLVKQSPERTKDIVRMLEIVANCHAFDSTPPLEEDELVSSTDKFDRKKRQNTDEVIETGEWTDWSHCSQQGFEARSRACEYGRKIQRRGCPARQPLQGFVDQPAPAPAPYAPAPRPRPSQAQRTQSPYDQYAHLYMERMREHQAALRHPASSQALPCVGAACPAPQPYQQPAPPAPAPPRQPYQRPAAPSAPAPAPAPQPRLQPAPPAPPPQLPQARRAPEESRYRPAPPPPPACNGEGCKAPDTAPGAWYPWSEWSECSCTCGDGMKQRRRECAGNNCQGSEYEAAPCNMGPCQTWSEWCEWSACSGSCGRGERTRARFCHLGTKRCEGSDFEVEPCDAGPCPEWADWSEWSRCSASCGSGVSIRQRTCLGGVFGDHMCPGPRSEERVCEDAPCSFWSSWQEWSGCSASCGAGMKRRQRICQYGTDCPGPQEETSPCYGPSCAAWTEWCEWSGCSVKCGPGQRTRTRACHASDGTDSRDCLGQSIETTLCEGTSCCRWSDWCHWTMCDQECGGGQSIRTRTCMNGNGIADDHCHCDGGDREQRECNTQSCTPQCSWTQWCEWSACSTPHECEVGIKNRSRQCVGEPGCHCFGPAEESHQCRGPNPCPTKVPC